MPTTNERRAAFRFFLENAGYIVGRRAEGALALARAEARLTEALELGIGSVEWGDDDEPYEHGVYTDEEVTAKFESNEWTGPYGCVVTIGDENASLWGIVVGPNGAADPYCRVVAAELAHELETDFFQAIRNALDRHIAEANRLVKALKSA